MTSYKEKLNHVNTFIFDVDGVLTDGKIILYKGEFLRTLNARDGYALQYAIKKGYQIFVITGGSSQEVKDRLEDLGVTEVRLGSKNKISVYKELQAQYNFKSEAILYMGDDIPDYEVLKEVGVATCPQDAAVEIKAACDYQSPKNGGEHCVRDVIEQTLRVQGNWFTEGSLEW